MQKKDEAIKNICASLLQAGKIEGYAYDHFRQSEAVQPSFAVYRRVATKNFSADGLVYHRGQSVDLELYAETPDEMAALMDATESLLTSSNLYYECTADTVYIEAEDFYETLYEV